MWSSAARSGRILLSKVGSSRHLSAGTPQVGEERFEFVTKSYPSFWNRLKQQKHGIGNMALSASIAFLAVSIIKQEKELSRATESADRLKQQNKALEKKLDDLKSVLVTSEKGEREVLALLRDVLKVERQEDFTSQREESLESTSGSKFMV